MTTIRSKTVIKKRRRLPSSSAHRKLEYCCLQVYKASLDQGTEDTREVAVKFLNPAEINGSVASQRRKFEEEITIMRMCEHPNIVGFLGCWIMPVRSEAQHCH